MSLTGPRIFAPKATAASYRRKKDEAAVLGMIHENLAAHVTIANFGLEHHVIDQFSMQNSVLTRSIRHLNYMSSLVEGSSYIGAMLLQIIILGVGAWMVATGWMTVGSLVSFQLIFLSLSASLTYVSQYAPTLVQATGGMARIEEILAIRPYVADAPDAVEQARLHHAIEFKNITFGYTQDAPILKNVSFTIPKGSYVAFVGLSGSGKSTILNLLSRSFDPQEGEIRIDGLDLRKVTLASHRYRIGVVAQENFLFNLSLKENIRLGKLQATDAEIEAAARLAELHDVITALPDGYETFAGERGSRLSGGQRQRIAISRALLRNPDILLLDEATSALDPATEAEINRTIDHLRQGTTIIMVTHRLASVGNCDQIFVMAQGEVCESGNFAELLEKGGMFKSIFDKQSGFEFSMDGRFAQIIPSRLGEFPLFKTVPKELLAELTLLFVTEHYRPDQVVIQEGDLDDKFYVIARGKVDVMKTLKNGMRIKLATYADGDHFGQIALLHNIPRTADVITTTYCTLLSMRRQKFNYVMKKVPQAYDILMKSSLSMLEEDAVYTTPQ